MSLNQAPTGERLHIGIFGPTNSGKSSLLNSLTGQRAALVSPKEGTTTDPVYKNMEVHGLGPITLIDTAGFKDQGDLGPLRLQRTREVIEKCDGFIYLLTGDPQEDPFLALLREKNKPLIYVLAKADLLEDKALHRATRHLDPLPFIQGDEASRTRLLEALRQAFKEEKAPSLLGGLVKKGDQVLLVMPQDAQAPKGRLILPQVQTLRALLDEGALALSCQPDQLEEALRALAAPPDLVITDSQCFKEVRDHLDPSLALTSFSVLFSAYKGDLDYFIQSVKALDKAPPKRVAILEACTHPPDSEDIGQVKIPRLLRKKWGPLLEIDFYRGQDPLPMASYDLLVHCGACLFNRTHVLNRVEKAKSLGRPMTNYGILIAYLQGILDQISLPKSK
ncbi:MAG: [FeFe] hydrogenase H-cluster maturation GTPase HydF [Tissierellia bacterium]|nr:[FeFe] hydrogenase H-cluster maturation GTPase HydF [Tissierellia bacterium]